MPCLEYADDEGEDRGYSPADQRLIDRAIETACLCDDEYRALLAEMETAERHGWMAEQERIDQAMMLRREQVRESFMADPLAITNALDVIRD